jgi:hypothetical protein
MAGYTYANTSLFTGYLVAKTDESIYVLTIASPAYVPRTSPEASRRSKLRADFFVQLTPFRVKLFNQIKFPLSAPFLKRFSRRAASI